MKAHFFSDSLDGLAVLHPEILTEVVSNIDTETQAGFLGIPLKMCTSADSD